MTFSTIIFVFFLIRDFWKKALFEIAYQFVFPDFFMTWSQPSVWILFLHIAHFLYQVFEFVAYQIFLASNISCYEYSGGKCSAKFVL